MGRLPHEFDGPRSPSEVRQDLLALACEARCAHVTVTAAIEDGEPDYTAGLITVVEADASDRPEVDIADVFTFAFSEDSSDRLEMYVDGVFNFAFSERLCRGGQLLTLDGSDYFTLKIDLAWGRIVLNDADNGR